MSDALSNPEFSNIERPLRLDRRNSGRLTQFLGVDFAPLDPATLLARVVDQANLKTAFGFLVTPNVDHLVRLHADSGLQTYYDEAWLNVCDSRILSQLAALDGIFLPACPGSDLTAQLLDHHIDKDETVVVVGADSEVIEALKTRYGLTNIAWHCPPMGLKNKPEAIEEAAIFMAENPARFNFLCVGSPQQEMVALAAKKRGDCIGVGLCVGASLDFLAGKAQRAPKWMQQAKLEWLHRLASEPKRMWKRYLVEGPKIFKIWWAWRKNNIA